MRKLLLCLSLIGLPLIMFAQTESDSEISLSAFVKDTVGYPLAFITVTNLSHDNGVISNEDGYFNISFDKEDTLELSAVGYKKQRLFFGDTTTVSEYDLEIMLTEETYELENVTVFAYKDEYAFKKALLALDDSELPEKQPKIKIPGSYDGPKVENKASLVKSPVSFIFNKVSAKAREERKAYLAEQEYEYHKTLSKKYNRDLVGKVTGLKEAKLDEFMSYCQLEDAFIEESNDYDIILAINRCYQDYKQHEN